MIEREDKGGGNQLTSDQYSAIPEWDWQPYEPTPEEIARQMAEYMRSGSEGPMQFQRQDGLAPQDEVRQMADDLQRMRGLAGQGRGVPPERLWGEEWEQTREALDTRLRLMADRIGAISQLPDAAQVAEPLRQAQGGVQYAGDSLRVRDIDAFDRAVDQAAGHLTLTIPDRGPDPGAPHLWQQNQVSAGKILLGEVSDRYAQGQEPVSPLRHLKDLLDSLTRGPARDQSSRAPDR